MDKSGAIGRELIGHKECVAKVYSRRSYAGDGYSRASNPITKEREVWDVLRLFGCHEGNCILPASHVFLRRCDRPNRRCT